MSNNRKKRENRFKIKSSKQGNFPQKAKQRITVNG